MACLAVPYFSTLDHKMQNFREKIIEHKVCVWFYLKLLSENFLLLRRIQRDVIINVHRSSCNVPAITVILKKKTLNLSRGFVQKLKYQISSKCFVLTEGRMVRERERVRGGGVRE